MSLSVIFRAAGVGFTLATFPGLVVSAVVRDVVARCCGVPSGRVADSRARDDAGPAAAVSGRTSREGAANAVTDGGTVGTSRPTYAADYRRAPTYRSLLAATAVPPVATALVAVLLFVAAATVVEFWTLRWWMLTWLGVAVAAHALPAADASRALRERSRRTDSRLRRVGAPLATAGRLAAALTIVRVDALIAAALYYLVAAALYPGAPSVI
ncbi:hypothetical protein [Halobaculum sp. EA56]|uniref:hypothetical protein n=1 Tax=Halobaculum sp. EA56 TaxID=3421648 RepID=UPI003EBD1A4B